MRATLRGRAGPRSRGEGFASSGVRTLRKEPYFQLARPWHGRAARVTHHDSRILAQRMRRLVSAVIVLLFVPAFWTSTRQLFPYVRWSVSVVREPVETRREMVLGDWVR